MIKLFNYRKACIVFCCFFSFGVTGCVTTEELEELDKLEEELDDAINDLEESLDDFETWSSCMEFYDYDPPEDACE